MILKNGKSKIEVKEKAIGSRTLKNRLFLLQASLVFAIIIGIVIVLVLTGTFELLNNQSYTALNSELERTASDVSRQLFGISQNTYEFSEKINKSITDTLKAQGFTISDLQTHSELLNAILNNEVNSATFFMQKSNASGVFIVLDATVNPSLPNAQHSKSGFYIKDIEPFPVPFTTKPLMLLRGSPEIARDFGMYLDTEWQLELDIHPEQKDTSSSFYLAPYYAALENTNKDIHHLGYWSLPFKLDKNCKKAVTFSVPLIDSEGKVYGICGLELSERFFNALMPPAPQDYNRLFYLVGIKENNRLSIPLSIHLGDYSARFNSSHPYFLSSSRNPSNLEFRNYTISDDENHSIVGLETSLNIYHSQSVFKDSEWVLLALLPPSDVAKTKALFLLIGLLFLLICGISIAIYISRSYTKPISMVFKQIIEKADIVDKTNIAEIDDLIEFLKEEQTRREENVKKASPSILGEIESVDISESQYEEFSKQLTSLTKTEREVFDMYIQGYSAKQICEKKFLSINTVKTHNRRIYAKLNVTSRAELLSYCLQLMRESDKSST